MHVMESICHFNVILPGFLKKSRKNLEVKKL